MEGNSLVWLGKNGNMTMRKIVVRAHNTRTQFVRSEMEPHWKVARPCLQTVKSWARGTGRGESRGVQKPAWFYGLRTAVRISFIVPFFADAPHRKTLYTNCPPVPISNYNPSPVALLFRPELLAANDTARS